jgi:8-oxo-dGTP diphosphatase
MGSVDPNFRHCPRCATALVLTDDHGVTRATCPACGFIHYRNPVPAAGVLLSRGEEVLLVRRKYDPRAGAWCLPAGFMEYGETPERCAVRELREETGIEARLTGLFGVFAGLDDPRARAVLVLYTAERVGGRLKAGDDAIEARYFPLGRLPRELAFAAHRRALTRLRTKLRRTTAKGRGARAQDRVVERRANSRRT